MPCHAHACRGWDSPTQLPFRRPSQPPPVCVLADVSACRQMNGPVYEAPPLPRELDPRLAASGWLPLEHPELHEQPTSQGLHLSATSGGPVPQRILFIHCLPNIACLFLAWIQPACAGFCLLLCRCAMQTCSLGEQIMGCAGCGISQSAWAGQTAAMPAAGCATDSRCSGRQAATAVWQVRSRLAGQQARRRQVAPMWRCPRGLQAATMR